MVQKSGKFDHVTNTKFKALGKILLNERFVYFITWLQLTQLLEKLLPRIILRKMWLVLLNFLGLCPLVEQILIFKLDLLLFKFVLLNLIPELLDQL